MNALELAEILQHKDSSQKRCVEAAAMLRKQAAEIEQLREICRLKHHAALRWFEKEAAMEKEIERLRKDADRYQWIRHGDNDEIVMKDDCRGPYLPRNERLDAAIDKQLEIERMTVYLTKDHVMNGGGPATDAAMEASK